MGKWSQSVTRGTPSPAKQKVNSFEADVYNNIFFIVAAFSEKENLSLCHAIVYKELQAMFSEALGEHVYLWAEPYTSSRRNQYML